MQTNTFELQFRAVAAGHNDGLAISSATVLSPSATYNPGKHDRILMQALTQNVRYTLDGTTPTASKGFQLKAGDPPVIVFVAGNILTVIEETATADLQFNFGG